MAFVIQTTAGNVADANAYIADTFFTTYHTDRGVASVIAVDFTQTQIEEAIIIATDYIDTRFRYIGDRQNDRSTQTTEWPRLDAVDRDQRLLNGIPLVVQQACAEYALFQLAGGPLYVSTTNPVTGQKTKRTFSKVDVIEDEIEYFQGPVGGTPDMPIYHVADQRLISAGVVEGPSGKLARA